MRKVQACTQVKCKVGDIVSKGQVVVVLEAMKMEYPIAAPAAGQVSTSGCITVPGLAPSNRRARTSASMSSCEADADQICNHGSG